MQLKSVSAPWLPLGRVTKRLRRPLIAKLNVKLTVTLDGKSTEVKTTKQYRDLMVQSIDGPTPVKSVLHCIFPKDITGSFCWKTILQVTDENRN